VAKALKDSSEATSKFQQVIVEIEGLQDALTRLAALEPTESNLAHVNAVRRMALACSLPMQDFLSRLEKYETTMSPFQTANKLKTVGMKTQFALFMSEEIKKMRAMISGKVISINLLLSTYASESLSRTEAKLSTDQRLSQIKNDTASTRRSASTITAGITFMYTSLGTLCGLGIQILSILRSFPQELQALLQNLVRTNIQMYAVLLEVHRKICASPTLTLDSNIRVEDAFGQVRSLPYERFRHWEPFEGLLRAEFKNRPGAERVERGDFRLVHAKRPRISIDKDAWSSTITAGADLVILMLLTDLASQGSACPRQSCNGRTSLESQGQCTAWMDLSSIHLLRVDWINPWRN
ncbi:hypothetical protein BU23DRAFT_457585, partial [Bimuria novae-zelandiae CBS 107.79]